MDAGERQALKAAAELVCGCRATFEEDQVVSVEMYAMAELRREVATFRLTGHPTSVFCYAWMETGDSERVIHHRVVLRTGPIDSAYHAVRTAVLREPPERSTTSFFERPSDRLGDGETRQ